MVIRIFFALVTLAVLCLAIGSLVYILEEVEKPKVAAAREIKEAAPPKPIDPGIREYEAALKLAKNRQLAAARDKLRYIIRYFPRSERHQMARNLCSEINLDLLISPNFAEGKKDYEVVSGDSLSEIAKKHETTIECLKRLNGMMDFKIMPGDHLLTRSLNFKVSVDTKHKTLTMLENGKFFAEFPVIDIRLPGKLRLPVQDTVRSKHALAGKSTLITTQRGYDLAPKELRLSRRGLKIVGHKQKESEDQVVQPGIIMDPTDVEELTMLLRVSTAVHIL